jgi:hypothetical protein
LGAICPTVLLQDGVDIIPVVAVIEPILEQPLDVFHVEKLSIVLDVIGCQEAVFLYLRSLEIFHGCNKEQGFSTRGPSRCSPACLKDF